MSGFLLYHRRTRPTGRVLAHVLGAGAEVAPDIRFSSVPNWDWVIRWGNRASLPGYAFRARVINGSDAIARASDKLESLGTMREAEVRVPDWSEDPEDLEFPFLGRRIQHTQGRDVVLCLQRGDYRRRPRDYYVKYIPTVREFRVHVVAGEVIRVQGKYLDFPEQSLPWIRNYGTGYRFREPSRRLRPSRTEMAIRAVESLGLDFGAVDLLVGDDGLEYVLEVNTAPACSPLTAEKYIRAFQRLLNIPDQYLSLAYLRQLSADDDVNEEPEEDDAALSAVYPSDD